MKIIDKLNGKASTFLLRCFRRRQMQDLTKYYQQQMRLPN